MSRNCFFAPLSLEREKVCFWCLVQEVACEHTTASRYPKSCTEISKGYTPCPAPTRGCYTLEKIFCKITHEIFKGNPGGPYIKPDRKHSIVVKNTDSGARLAGFRSYHYHLALWPWASHLTSVGLSFLIHKIQIIVVLSSQGCYKD